MAGWAYRNVVGAIDSGFTLRIGKCIEMGREVTIYSEILMVDAPLTSTKFFQNSIKDRIPKLSSGVGRIKKCTFS